jgi:mono/diheme cytochrome c family protein
MERSTMGRGWALRLAVLGILLGMVLAGTVLSSSASSNVQAAEHTPTATPMRPRRATRTPMPTRALAVNRTPVATRPPAPPPTPTRTVLPAGVPPDGLTVYKSMGCVGCHRLAAAGSVGGLGPSHDHVATVAMERLLAADYTGSATTAEGYLRESIEIPELYVAPEYRKIKYRMPAYDFLQPEQIDALVLLLVKQR